MAARVADYVPIKEAARRLGVKPKEIRRRIKDGELDGYVRLPRVDETGLPIRSVDGGAVAESAARDAHSQRLEETVLVLQSELNTRKREVDELHVLLRELKENLPAVVGSPAGTQVSVTAGDQSSVTPAQVGSERSERGLNAAQSDAVIDWNAYDAESEQLRATMSRLESLLEQLESVDEEEEEVEPATEAQPEQTHTVEARQEAPPPVVVPPPSAREPVVTVAPPMMAPSSPPAQTESESPSPAASTARPGTTPSPLAGSAAPKPARAPRPAPAPATAPAAGTDEPPLGDALNRRREKMGVSREALAAFSRLSWGFITEVESGRRRDPRSRQRLANALDAWQNRLNEEKKAG